jgi:polysaccharide biosynthesis protein PslH
MRILLVTPMPPRPEAPGAIPLVLHALLTGLQARHDVTLVTVVGDEPGEAEAAVELRHRDVDVHVIDRRQPRGLARWRRRWRLATTWALGCYPWRTIWFADPGVQETLDRLTREGEFDVAAVEDNSMGVFRLPRQLPTVLTEHEVQCPRPIDWQCGSPVEWPRWAIREADRRRWPAYQHSVWRRFDRIQVFSERDANLVAEFAPDVLERVRLNPFGIDPPQRADPAREERGLVLFAGNFTHPPNVDAAVWLASEIMPRLRARHNGVRLVLIGTSPPREVHALAAWDVQILGEVPTIAPYLEAAAVVLAPVRSGGGMRMKVLYALASGKAVVTTRRGAEGLLFDRKQPPLVVAEDAETIARAAARLLGDDALRRALAERARAFAAEHHGPEAYGRRLETVYEEAISRRHSPVTAAAGD